MSTLVLLLVTFLIFHDIDATFLDLFNEYYKSGGDDVLPTYWDWRGQKRVSSVKNQMSCKASHAFSLVGAMESQYMIQKNTSKERLLSEQMVIDCGLPDYGCSNGDLQNTYRITLTERPIVVDDAVYPYKNQASGSCDAPTEPGVKLANFFIGPRNEDVMKYTLYHRGPISVQINSEAMRRWDGKEATIDDPTEQECSKSLKKVDHAVLITGYSVYVDKNGKETPYWIIKNSWGTEWGQDGYYYLIRGKNACGVANTVLVPGITV